MQPSFRVDTWNKCQDFVGWCLESRAFAAPARLHTLTLPSNMPADEVDVLLTEFLDQAFSAGAHISTAERTLAAVWFFHPHFDCGSIRDIFPPTIRALKEWHKHDLGLPLP